MKFRSWHTPIERLKRLGLEAADCDEQFTRSSGKGGQNINKVATCVVLTHRPTGITVRCDEERTQGQNRYLAWKRLADKYEAMKRARAARSRHETEKRKRQNRGRNRAAKERMLQDKRHRAQIKEHRRERHWDE